MSSTGRMATSPWSTGSATRWWPGSRRGRGWGGSGSRGGAGGGSGEGPRGRGGPGAAVPGAIPPALDEAALLVANPADGNVYFYMEGMVAPMATFRNYGHRPAALEGAHRSLKAGEPGVYSGTVRFRGA